MSYATPTVLADEVLKVLATRTVDLPVREAIIQLFEVMYCCSISKEEAEGISFHVVYIDPENPDPNPAPKRLPDEWRLTKFEAPIEVNLSNMRKLAPATDPRSSALAVYHDIKGRPIVTGFVDQLNSYEDFINMEISTGQRRPGVFEARIVGLGHLVVNVDYERIAELSISEIKAPKIDVFDIGPIREGLDYGINSFIEEVRKLHPSINKSKREPDAAFKWLSCLKRILLRMQNLQHGGAILIVPNELCYGLKTKFKFRYDRLRTAIETHVTLLRKYQEFHHRLDHDQDFNIDTDSMRKWYIEYFFWDKKHSDQELKATIWFISLLTRIDGLVIMSQQLEVIGFGAEITEAEEPKSIKKVLSALAEPTYLEDMPYVHYGTRHRSMMRYCNKYPGSIGFVVSQDGDVRAITKVKNDVCIWEDVKLNY